MKLKTRFNSHGESSFKKKFTDRWRKLSEVTGLNGGKNKGVLSEQFRTQHKGCIAKVTAGLLVVSGILVGFGAGMLYSLQAIV